MIKEHVEQIADGTSAFFERTLPIEQLGQPIEGAMNSSEALRAAGLHDWDMRKVPLFAVESDRMAAQVPAKFGVVRDVYDNAEHDGEPTSRVLGVVGTKYEIVQNEQAFGFVDNLLDMSGEPIPFEYGGSLYGGRKVFVGLKLPKSISVGGHDDVDMRLLLVNTNDGTSPFSISLHINRVPCTNAIELTRRNAKQAQQHWQLRHTASIEGRVQAARETLKLTFAAVDEFEREAAELYAKQISDRQFERLVENVFPIEPLATKRAREATQQTRLEVRSIYREAPTQSEIRGTAWGALNAFVEWADWARDVRPGKRDAAEARALSQLDSRHVATFKANIMDRVLSMR
jgi:phage/plasmid-like protein (TIGR03299 family)